MSAQSVALAHYGARARLASMVDAEARRSWRRVDPADLDGSWAPAADRLTVALAGAQQAAAAQADTYLDEVLAEQHIDPATAGRVAARSLAGVASDGRDLRTLLDQPVITAKVAIAGGATTDRAMASGLATLLMLARTQLADAGRVADGVAVAARPRAGGYVRMVAGTTCPRCVILAGRFFRWNQGFQRHPRCDCVHIPSREAISGDLRTSPRALIESGQVKGLSRADERAILEFGADPAQVVNAHRGMTTAGGRKLTTTGTTRRGLAGRRLRGEARLMPETILNQATSRDEAISLLRQHGFIL